MTLAGLLARRGEVDAARAVLAHVPRQVADALDVDEAKLLLALLITCDQREAAAELTARLHAAHGERGELAGWLAVMRPPGAGSLPRTSEASVDRLACELLSQPEVVPSLVVAQQHRADRRQVAMLRGAIEQLAPHFEDHHPRLVMVCHALAELALLDGDGDAARHWAHRGLKLSPGHEKLGLVLAELEDDPAVGPPASEVLGRIVAHHPRYPDVRRAWIRRTHRDGQANSARRLLNLWLQREPDSPIAHALDKELVA